MSLKAYTIKCDRLFPGTTVHYAAHSAHAAVNEAIISMAKIGNLASRIDIDCKRAPELDHIASQMQQQGSIEATPATL